MAFVVGVITSPTEKTLSVWRGMLRTVSRVRRRVVDLPRGDASEQARQSIKVPRNGVICARDKKYPLPIGRG